jgi:phage gp46-like protein
MWDLARDPRTGDWIFSGNRDIQDVIGAAVILQRINARLRIPRGEWLYDVDRDLGSRLYLAERYQMPRTLREAGEMIREALEPMTDVRVVSVETEVRGVTEAVAIVNYEMVSLPGEGIASTNPENKGFAVIPLTSAPNDQAN